MNHTYNVLLISELFFYLLSPKYCKTFYKKEKILHRVSYILERKYSTRNEEIKKDVPELTLTIANYTQYTLNAQQSI